MSHTKIISMYLPQFHRVPENDTWWGEGFTEWTAVKSAEPLFEGHYQPRVPLNNNYYDLLKKDTMQWQADLMKTYGVYGQCIYHYWFKDGRQILEKPAENLLRWKDINMPFCFAWANETWARSWSRLQGINTWSEREERRGVDEYDDGILLLQDYGEEEEWKNHFNYLLPFFQDERYIRLDGRPVFLLLIPDDIPCLVKMIDCWRVLSQDNKIQEPYYISVRSEHSCMDAWLAQEPRGIRTNRNGYDDAGKFSYEETCERIVEREIKERRYYGVFSGYDDTPRRGRQGIVYEGTTPVLFQRTLTKMLRKCRDKDFLFINAWNEWGEGMYLEPDERFGYGYLEAVKRAQEDAQSADIDADETGDAENQSCEVNYLQKKVNQYRCYWKILDKWMLLKEEGRQAIDFLHKRGTRDIAIYGLGMLGKHLLSELKDSDIELIYGIDRKGEMPHWGFPVYTLQDELPEVSTIVVTVQYEFPEIYRKLQGKTKAEILSIQELLD